MEIVYSDTVLHQNIAQSDNARFNVPELFSTLQALEVNTLSHSNFSVHLILTRARVCAESPLQTIRQDSYTGTEREDTLPGHSHSPSFTTGRGTQPMNQKYVK